MTDLELAPDDLEIADVIDTDAGALRVGSWWLDIASGRVTVAGHLVTTGAVYSRCFRRTATLSVHRGRVPPT